MVKNALFAGIGPALVDYIYVIDNYPKRGGQAVIKSSYKMAGGACANVIYGLSKLGIKCRFYSTIGKDEDANFFIKSMENVDLRLFITHEKTGKVFVYVDKDGERTFFVHPNASEVLNIEICEEEYKEIDYFYLDPFPSKNSLDLHLKVAKNAKRFDKFVILNPGYPYVSLGFKRLSRLLKFTDLVIISRDEFKSLEANEDDFLKFVDILVITLGKDGSKAVTKDREYYQPAFNVKVVDTTGAGDAFAVGFLYGFINNLSLDLCLRLGNFIASYNIQYYGARNYPDKDLIKEILKKEQKHKTI